MPRRKSDIPDIGPINIDTVIPEPEKPKEPEKVLVESETEEFLNLGDLIGVSMDSGITFEGIITYRHGNLFWLQSHKYANGGVVINISRALAIRKMDTVTPKENNFLVIGRTYCFVGQSSQVTGQLERITENWAHLQNGYSVNLNCLSFIM